MAASTGMIKDKKPLEIIWNNYNETLYFEWFHFIGGNGFSVCELKVA